MQTEVCSITDGSTAKIRSTEPFWDYCLQPDDKSGHRLQLMLCSDPSTVVKDHESEKLPAVITSLSFMGEINQPLLTFTARAARI